MTNSWKRRIAVVLAALACLPAAAASGSAGAGEREEAAADPAVYLQLIHDMQRKGLYYASLAHLDAFAARWPDHAEAQLLRADALRETGDAGAAAQIYRRFDQGTGALAARAAHGLGLIAMREKRVSDGIAALARAAALAPTNTPVLNDLGYARLLAGDLDGARGSLYRAAELDAGNARVGANLALLLLLEGRADDADGVMQRYKLTAKVRDDIRRLAAARQEERP